jgi:hypothetical protein
MKCPTNIPLPCAFHFVSMMVMPHKHPTSNFIKPLDHQHQSTFGLISNRRYDPLHVITWPYWFIDCNFACSSSPLHPVHRCQVLALASLPHGPLHPSLWLAFHTSNPVLRSQDMSLDLIHLSTMALSVTHTCGLSTCVSQHKYTLVHLGSHSITKTEVWAFTRAYILILFWRV